MRLLVLCFAICYIAMPAAALFKQCSNFEVEDLEEKVTVNNCKAKYCPLKRGHKTGVEIKFTPTTEVKTLKNKVNADIAGLPFPFIGTDGTSANDNVFEEDGTTKATFPLKAGQNYLFKRDIDVLSIYPTIRVKVHWELDMPDRTPVTCFEVDAKIIN